MEKTWGIMHACRHYFVRLDETWHGGSIDKESSVFGSLTGRGSCAASNYWSCVTSCEDEGFSLVVGGGAF